MAAVLEAEGLDALLVTSRPNIRYLTGFSGSAGVALATRSALLVVTDFRYDEQARQECGAVARVAIEATSVWDRLFKELPTLGGSLEVIGFEAHSVTVKEAERFSSSPAATWRWQPAGELVERLRVRKDAGEIAAIRSAAALAAAALRETLDTVRPAQTELEIAARLESALRRRGSEAHPFPTIVASGPRSALPHAHTSSRTVAAGEWLLLDFGAVVDGYCADVTRTVIVGARADESQRALYAMVQDAQRRAREGVRAGMSGREADALAREPIEARGFGAAFGHSTGHGLGLEVHEAPRLARTVAEPLPENAVVTIEPGVYLAGRGGVRIEDDVHLSSDGPVLLTDGCTELLELV
ncbi:MAG TPA: aminopeptidase P family protein [Gemmatimonadales bacterium]|nr:aminopeptidase P family protein [Gemmatimonadales bacterium]